MMVLDALDLTPGLAAAVGNIVPIEAERVYIRSSYRYLHHGMKLPCAFARRELRRMLATSRLTIATELDPAPLPLPGELYYGSSRGGAIYLESGALGFVCCFISCLSM
jgi:hypothetical protein